MRIEKRILCIWLPNWPIQRLVVDQPELKDKPVLLHDRDSRRGDVISACSRTAKRNGIRIGMPLAEATALAVGPAGNQPKQPRHAANRHPLKNVQARNREADLRQLQNLAEWCQQQFSPLVGLEQAETPQGLLLETAGTSHLFGGEPAMARQVAQAFQKRGYWPHIAIAQSVGAALAFARFGVALQYYAQDTKDQAVAPDPIVVGSNETRDHLCPLPIAALRIENEAHRLLRQLGVVTVNQLLQLPRDGISSRFGDGVLHRVDQALGSVDEVLVANQPLPVFQTSLTLEHPTDRRNVIERVLQKLANELIDKLAQHDQGAIQVQCEFINTQRQQAHFEVGLFRPTANAPHLLSLLSMQLESHTLPRSIVKVRLYATTTARLPHSQLKLLHDMTRDNPQQLSILVDRLTSRLGKQAVTGTRLRSGALPEFAYATIPLTGDRSAQARLNAASGKRSAPRPMERPLLLFDPPRPLQALSLQAPLLDDIANPKPPAQFEINNRLQKVLRYWGPERIETSWWKGPCIRRDYYRVESQHGNFFWLFRHLDDGKWFLHGEFA